MTGWRWGPEMCVRSSCRTHLWITLNSPLPVDYGCGFVQSAQCVVCGDLTAPLDAEWWYEKATTEHVEALIMHLHGERARLAQVIEDLDGEAESGDVMLRNFDA